MNLKNTLRSVALAASMTFAGAALATQPAIVFDLGGRFDKSFNEAAHNGMERWKQSSGQQYLDFEIANESQREQAVMRMAERGANPVISVGFAQAAAIEAAAKEFPQQTFAIIDMVVDLPNVQSVVFKEHEGSFLVGMIAAMASQTGKVGFVGGMDIPLIRRFQCGYEQGVKFVNPQAEVFANMTGTTGAAWRDPARGGELARAQFARGADVVFAAAGATGLGVLQAAADAGKFSIGVDSNQNHLHPGSVLTSMLKMVDEAVFQVASNPTPGVSVLGLAEGGVGYAIDEHNEQLISAEMRERVEAAKADIIAGRIQVVDYMANNNCNF